MRPVATEHQAVDLRPTRPTKAGVAGAAQSPTPALMSQVFSFQVLVVPALMYPLTRSEIGGDLAALPVGRIHCAAAGLVE
jgi:hypothetical protein